MESSERTQNKATKDVKATVCSQAGAARSPVDPILDTIWSGLPNSKGLTEQARVLTPNSLSQKSIATQDTETLKVQLAVEIKYLSHI